MNRVLEGWNKVLQVLPADLEESAKEKQAFLRARGVPDAQTLLRLLLVYSTTPLSFRATVSWARGVGIADLTDVSLIERMERCEPWLAYLLTQMLKQKGPSRPVHLVDATHIVAPNGDLWRLHVVYDGQSIVQCQVGDVRMAEHFKNVQPEAGVLYIADRGYAHPKGITGLVEAHSLVLCRIKGRDYIQHAKPNHIVEVATEKGRVIIAPLPEEKKAKAQKRVTRKASRNQRKVSQKTLETAEYLFLFCSDASISPEQAVSLYRWRWQIELLFKRLKSLQKLDEMAVKSPPLVRVYLLCHALMAALAETLKPDKGFFPPEAVEAAVSLAALAIPLSSTESSDHALRA